MHNGAWEALLRHIPAELHNKLMIMTASGTEIAVQSLMRIDRELLIIKGRLSGSQDQGRLFFLPFVDIDYVGTYTAITDEQFAQMFESMVLPEGPEPESAPPPEPVVGNGNGKGNGHGQGSGPRPALRSEVLERFRTARTTGPSSSANLSRPGQS